MKAKLTMLFLFMFLMAGNVAFASFPVERTATTEQVSSTDDVTTSELVSSPAAVAYDKWVAVALWFFLGGFAAHRWYAGKPVGWNILFILTLGGLGIWAIIDLINILTDNFE